MRFCSQRTAHPIMAQARYLFAKIGFTRHNRATVTATPMVLQNLQTLFMHNILPGTTTFGVGAIITLNIYEC